MQRQASASDPETGINAGVDALGDLDEGDFGTTVDGSISEARSPVGFASVNGTVHTSNALMRAFAFDPDFNAIPLFGYLSIRKENPMRRTIGVCYRYAGSPRLSGPIRDVTVTW